MPKPAKKVFVLHRSRRIHDVVKLTKFPGGGNAVQVECGLGLLDRKSGDVTTLAEAYQRRPKPTRCKNCLRRKGRKA